MVAKAFLRHSIEAAFILAIVILLIAGFLSYRTIKASVESAALVQHTYEVINTLDQLSAAVAVVDSSSRGFALTSDASYLRLNEAAVTSARRHLSNLHLLTSENHERQQSLNTVEQVAAQNIEFAIDLIALRRSRGLEAAVAALRHGAGETDRDEIQADIDLLKDDERQVLANRSEAAAQNSAQSERLLLLGTLLGLLITASAGISVVRDAYKRRAAEEELFAEKERAQVTLNSIGDGVIRVDTASDVTFLNRAAELMTGWPAQEAVGRPFGEIFHIIDSVSRAPVPNRMQMAVAQGRTLRLPENSILVRRNGVEIPIEDTVAPIHDADGKIAGAVNVFRDVSAAREMTLKLVHAAHHDALTGLPNRILLNDRISQAIARAARNHKKIAVLFLDLDGFKQINDSLGHSVGDELLQAVTEELEKCIRDCDTVSRLGGDEFVVVVSDLTQAEEAALTALRIAQAMEKMRIPACDIRVTVSIGVSLYPEDGAEPETLLKNADSAMYEAKVSGRNTFKFYRPEGLPKLRRAMGRRASP